MAGPNHEVSSDPAPFVGRDDLLSTAQRMLDELNARLLTLTGPGGVGKTRMAEKLAALQPKRSWVVDLRPLAGQSEVTADRLIGHLALTMDIRRNGPVTLDVVRDHLGGRPALVVLDNCDQFLDAARAFVPALLSAVPGLRIVATSREDLDLEAEHLLRVQPLELKHAVALFVEHARKGGVEPAELANAAAVEELCEKGDRLPLALRLLAVKVARGMSVTDLIALLADDRFGTLSGLAAVVAVSYDQCSPEEQLVWQRLGVFAGAFDPHTATAVAGGAGVEPARVRHVITELVGKSVISVERAGGATRYRMLDTLRDYGLRELRDDARRVRDLHRDHFARGVEAAALEWFGPHEIKIMTDLYGQLEDILAAVDHSLAVGDTVAAAALALALIRTRAPHFFGFLDLMAQTLKRAVAAFEQAGETVREEHFAALATTAAAHGWVLATQGRAAEARAMAALAEAQFTGRGLEIPAELRYPLGAIEALASGDPKAIDMLARARAAFARAGVRSDGHMAAMMESLAASFATIEALAAGDPAAAEMAARARTIAKGYRAEAEESQGPWSIAWGVWADALAAHLEDREEAVALAHDCLGREEELGDGWGGLWAAALTAGIYAAQLAGVTDPRERAAAARLAARLLGEADRRRDVMGIVGKGLGPLHRFRAQAQDQIRAVLDPAEYAKYYEAGRRKHGEATRLALGKPVSARPRKRSTRGELTSRERDVLELVARGLTNAEIGADLHLSPATVGTHLKNASAKIGVHNRTAAAYWYTTNLAGERA
ncbi:LuxR C-terminal-related transcriptional regulator [Actinoplanes subtropicus]|uniref:LuxR C-terminal-related transcriptional regulator n=1 Tax=Actinoplanes subtropicus TaxID=543632 RepID=UPI0004C447DB|nr:LuxR C-terminal-related transcriptional regulator [Actinoplanes subtropicus]